MSILNVEHLTHGFGDRAIFEDVSFPSSEGRTHWTCRRQRRRKVHVYEHRNRKADAR